MATQQIRQVQIPAYGFFDYLCIMLARKRQTRAGLADELGMPRHLIRVMDSRKQAIPIKWFIPIAKWMELSPVQLWSLLECEAAEPPIQPSDFGGE